MKYSTEKISEYRKYVSTLEKVVSIPARGMIIIILLLPIYSTLGSISENGSDDVSKMPTFFDELKIIAYSIIAYLIVNVCLWAGLFLWKKSKNSMYITKAILLGMLLVDLSFISLLLFLGTEIAGPELESTLFWVYCLLIIRSVIYFPEIKQQICVIGAIILFYVSAYYYGTYDTAVLGPKIIILVLVNVSAWGLYDMYLRRLVIADEVQERTIRVERLNLAGLVAKETAHSLKNPLAIINNACYLLGKNVDEKDNDAAEHLSIIKKQVQRADGIISELTKYSELAGAKIGNVDVNREIVRCIHDLDYEIKERKIAIVEELDPILPKLIIEEGQLRQVLSNILLNACQAIDHKKGRIVVRTITDSNNDIIIEIEDNGKGIDEKDLDNIFKSYFTTKDGGTGIGLSIAHTVIQAFNGSIDVESEIGKGTKFTILFPTRTHRIR